MANYDRPAPISTSQQPKFDPEQERLWREVLQLLTDKKVPFVVSGAFALQHHTGIWRETKDLDLFLPPEEVSGAMRHLHAAGFDLCVKDRVWLAKARRNGHFVDLITGMSNGVITVNYTWVERGIPANVLGVSTRVQAAEELLASKLFVSFRERFDGADIVHLVFGTRGKMDWRRLSDLVGEHWELLLWVMVFYQYVYPAYAHYIPRAAWDDLLARLRNKLDNPDRNAPFRGSLIDENMFAIDIHEWGMQNIVAAYRIAKMGKIPELAEVIGDAPAEPAA